MTRPTGALTALIVVLLLATQAEDGPCPCPCAPHPEARARGTVSMAVTAHRIYVLQTGLVPKSPDCFVTPKACSEHSEDRPTLEPEDLSRLRQGDDHYTYEMHKGPGSSLAWTATPRSPNAKGYKSFCDDSASNHCTRKDGITPEVRDGECVVSAACEEGK